MIGKLAWGLVLLATVSCTLTSKTTEKKSVGKVISEADFVAALQKPGALSFEKIVAADWSSQREKILNLDDPKAKAAGLEKGTEDLQIYVYAVAHPSRGSFLIDSGISQQMKDDLGSTPMGGLAGRAMNVKAMRFHRPTAELLKSLPSEVRSIFVTHMHADHLAGVADIPQSVTIYTGPGEASKHTLKNALVRGLTDDLLEGDRAVTELDFPAPLTILDVYEDQSFFAIWVPGHTRGSLAFVANSKDGSHLIVGDNAITRWGWDNSVTPGAFTDDKEANAAGLNFLRSLKDKVPGLTVHVGHQP